MAKIFDKAICAERFQDPRSQKDSTLPLPFTQDTTSKIPLPTEFQDKVQRQPLQEQAHRQVPLEKLLGSPSQMRQIFSPGKHSKQNRSPRRATVRPNPASKLKVSAASSPAGVVFKCASTRRVRESLRGRILGLRRSFWPLVERIENGTTIFLLDEEKDELHGVFEAESTGALNLDSKYLVVSPDGGSLYPAQVQIRTKAAYKPVPLGALISIPDLFVKGSQKILNKELTTSQVHAVIMAFQLARVEQPGARIPVPKAVGATARSRSTSPSQQIWSKPEAAQQAALPPLPAPRMPDPQSEGLPSPRRLDRSQHPLDGHDRGSPRRCPVIPDKRPKLKTEEIIRRQRHVDDAGFHPRPVREEKKLLQRDLADDGTFTTVFFGSIPEGLTPNECVDSLDAAGFLGCYDFFLFQATKDRKLGSLSINMRSRPLAELIFQKSCEVASRWRTDGVGHGGGNIHWNRRQGLVSFHPPAAERLHRPPPDSRELAMHEKKAAWRAGVGMGGGAQDLATPLQDALREHYHRYAHELIGLPSSYNIPEHKPIFFVEMPSSIPLHTAQQLPGVSQQYAIAPHLSPLSQQLASLSLPSSSQQQLPLASLPGSLRSLQPPSLGILPPEVQAMLPLDVQAQVAQAYARAMQTQALQQALAVSLPQTFAQLLPSHLLPASLPGSQLGPASQLYLQSREARQMQPGSADLAHPAGDSSSHQPRGIPLDALPPWQKPEREEQKPRSVALSSSLHDDIVRRLASAKSQSRLATSLSAPRQPPASPSRKRDRSASADEGQGSPDRIRKSHRPEDNSEVQAEAKDKKTGNEQPTAHYQQNVEMLGNADDSETTATAAADLFLRNLPRPFGPQEIGADFVSLS